MNWIVVADNSVELLQDAGHILCKRKMRVTGFRSGQALLEFLKDNQPDLILLGSVLWEIGGFEAISALKKARKTGKEIPVLLMAEQGEQDMEARARAMGAAGVVGRPLVASELMARVLDILASNQQPAVQENAPICNTLEEVANTLEERNESTTAMWMGSEVFGNVYRHMLRYLERYHGIAFQILFTVEMSKSFDARQRQEIMTQFRHRLQMSLRSSDMMMESGENQVFLLLPEVGEADIGHVISRVIGDWKQTEYGPGTDIISEVRQANLNRGAAQEDAKPRTDWVVVVDDDVANLKMAGLILSRQHMRVTALKSGRALLEYIRNNTPDVILLDVRMPEMDGFETMRLLKQEMAPGQEIPVIFLTADDNAESEMKGLNLGAMDFIKKPFVPDVLTARVKHIIQLSRLQKNLAEEVELKTQENENLSMHVVQTLAETIDAKDTYTNGHSGRVAEYARQIAQRLGYGKYFVSEQGGYITDDHLQLNQCGIPCADVIASDTEEGGFCKTWHTKADNINNIDKNTLKAVGQTITEVIFTE